MIYGHPMTLPPNLITAAEATSALGFKHRSSLTRLVQQKLIEPALKASGKTGEEFFDRADVERLKAERESAKHQDGAA